VSYDELPIERALGIQWCVESDKFQVCLALKDQPMTRRGILSTVASIYDPLGFLSPCVLIGKQILQQMCKDGLDWDSPLSEEQQEKWELWRNALPSLADMKIERCFKPKDFGEVEKIELHHFSDASTIGYGQCSYLRLVDVNNNVHCTLAMAKAKVNPKKQVTIPRLELQAATISAKVSRILKQ